jgi:hypothetical protein
VALCAPLACADGVAPHSPAGPLDVVITEPNQRAAAVGRRVTIIGVQTRTKLPTVCGVDVDGDYALSDREVIVNGVLHRDVVTEVDNTMANRGRGTFYSVIDPATGALAKTALH